MSSILRRAVKAERDEEYGSPSSPSETVTLVGESVRLTAAPVSSTWMTSANRDLFLLVLFMVLLILYVFPGDLRVTDLLYNPVEIVDPEVYLGCRPVDKEKNVAVIMPFMERQVPRIVANLKAWKDGEYYPCDYVGGSETPEKVDFLFYYDLDLEEREKQINEQNTNSNDKITSLKEALLDQVRSMPEYFRCFRKVGFISAKMTAEESTNVYGYHLIRSHHLTRGTVWQFYSLFFRQDLEKEYRHFFMMEPDNFPIRSGWLDAVYTETNDGLGTVSSFWMKGSMMQYERNIISPALEPYRTQYQYHINGNSIFRLGDPCFRRYLELIRAEYRDYAFDTAMIFYRYSKRHYSTAQRTIHRFRYTDVLCDMSTHKYTRDTFPNTYLVHGKYMFGTKFSLKHMGAFDDDPKASN